MAITIEQRVLITGGGAPQKHPWMVKPDTIKSVGGTQFVKLSKVDYGFARFVQGAQAKSFKNMGFLHDLAKKRCDATMGLTAPKQPQLFDDDAGELSRRCKKLKKTEAAAQMDTDTIVTLSMPAIATDDGLHAAACELKVLASLNEQAAVWLELSEAALGYVRVGLLASASTAANEGDTKYMKIADGVRFHSGRNAFIASRNRDDHVSTKTFKVAKPFGDDEKQVALDKAKAWAAGESDTEQELGFAAAASSAP